MVLTLLARPEAAGAATDTCLSFHVSATTER